MFVYGDYIIMTDDDMEREGERERQTDREREREKERETEREREREREIEREKERERGIAKMWTSVFLEWRKIQKSKEKRYVNNKHPGHMKPKLLAYCIKGCYFCKWLIHDLQQEI